MKKLFTSLLLCALFAAGTLAQKPSAVIKKASESPVIDGWIEDVWSEANVYSVDQEMTGQEGATLGPSGTITWRYGDQKVIIRQSSCRKDGPILPWPIPTANSRHTWTIPA